MTIPWLSDLNWEFNDALREGRLAQVEPRRLAALIAIVEEAQRQYPDGSRDRYLQETLEAAERVE